MSKRLILLIIGILMLCALSALATETRVATMGFNGLYLKDDAGIFYYPGTMPMYKKLIIAEHQSNFDNTFFTQFHYSDQTRVGIIMPAFGNGTLAVFAGEGQERFNTGGGYTLGFFAPTTRFLVGYGMNTGNASLGFQVDFSGSRQENNQNVPPPQTGTPDLFKSSTWAFAVGLTTPMGDLNNLDLGFRIRIGSYENKLDSATEVLQNKSDGNTALTFNLRDYYALNDYLNLVPVGSFSTASEKNIEYQGVDSNNFKFTTTNIEGGLGLQTKPTETSEIIGGVGYRSEKFRTKVFDDASGNDTLNTDNSRTTTSLPYAFLGFEAQVKGWMHFRLGVEKSIETVKMKAEKPVAAAAADEARNEWKFTNSPLRYAVGVGITAGPVTMDAQVDNDWWNQGPNFLSGTTNGDMFPRISFTYNFK